MSLFRKLAVDGRVRPIRDDIRASIYERRVGTTITVTYGWGASLSKVLRIDDAGFTFDVFDCNTGRLMWSRSLAYSKGTNLRYYASEQTIHPVACTHHYVVRVLGFGDYLRRNANGARAYAHFTYGPHPGPDDFFATGHCA